MAILMDDGSVLTDVAYITSAQLGRPFPVRWVDVPDRHLIEVTLRDGTSRPEVTVTALES